MNFRHDDASESATTTPFPDKKLPPQVLVVDDAKEIRDSITIILRASGYGVLEAEDGFAAQAILRTRQPSLVISDLEMPVCDGWDVLEYCHAQHPNLPVLIMSGAALGRRPEIERLAAGFLAKPFSLERFRGEIHRLIYRAA